MIKNGDNKKSKDKKKSDEQGRELTHRVEELENQVKRVLADYQNLEKRSQEERSSWIRIANKELLLRLLPILDTLMVAQKHSEDKTLEVLSSQFLDILKSEGVTRIETEGQEFNPRTMECIEAQEGAEGKVLEELRSGYLLGDVVLRPAQVKVGKASNQS